MTALSSAVPLCYFFLLCLLTFNQFHAVKNFSLGDVDYNWIKNNCPSNSRLPGDISSMSAGSGGRTFGQAYNTFIRQVKGWKFQNLNKPPFCEIFHQWVLWVKSLFRNAPCDSGSGKWCNADRDKYYHLITDSNPPMCTPYFCKKRPGAKCKFHSHDKDRNNNDGKWKRGTCKKWVPCLVTCLRVHSDPRTPRTPERYAGKIQEAWGNYINSAQKKRSEEEEYYGEDNVDDDDYEIYTDDEESTAAVEEESLASTSSTKWQRKQQSIQWIKSLLMDRLSKRGKRQTIDKRFDWNCDSNSSCDTCPNSSTGAYCKEWSDGSNNCCICVNF